MANPGRGAYGAQNIQDFDADEMYDDSERSRLPLLVLIALVVLAAFGGVVWLAYTQGVERGRAYAPIVITRIAPAPPKAAPSPYAGLNIYQPATAQSSDAEKTGAVPPPPAPLKAAQPASTPPALRPSAEAKQEPPPLTPSLGHSHPATTPPQQIAEQSPAPAPKKAKPVEAPPAPPSTMAAAPPSPAVAAPSAPPAASPAAAASSGGVLVQIGSYKSDSEAMHSWNAFKGRHAIAAAYQPDVQKVDLGAKGIWYRLRLGAFADRKSAVALCERLKAQGASCLVAR